MRNAVQEAPAATPTLPPWAQVTPKRLAHIGRVTALLMEWADRMHVADDERRAWRDAGLWHDALRDAPEAELRALVPEFGEREVEVLHGPAAAAKLVAAGERREGLLLAVRHHTIGSGEWDRVGKALYMADFLEPGRSFLRSDRAFLSRLVPHEFDDVFRHVVRLRLEWALREGHTLFPEAVSLWNQVR